MLLCHCVVVMATARNCSEHSLSCRFMASSWEKVALLPEVKNGSLRNRNALRCGFMTVNERSRISPLNGDLSIDHLPVPASLSPRSFPFWDIHFRIGYWTPYYLTLLFLQVTVAHKSCSADRRLLFIITPLYENLSRYQIEYLRRFSIFEAFHFSCRLLANSMAVFRIW